MHHTNRRHLLTSMSAALMLNSLPSSVAKAMTVAQSTTPDTAEFETNLATRFKTLKRNGKLLGLHGFVVQQRGRIVFERYMQGEDNAWGQSLGTIAFGPETLHDLRSVTKSIVGLLYGIALANGHVPGVDEPLIAQFSEYPDLQNNAHRSRLTVRHALTMTLGTEWNENLPYTDPRNNEIAMELASDRYRYILDRPALVEPGKSWIYSGGAVALLGKIIEKGTGLRLPEFARKALFEPLGISSVEWAKGKDGEASAASGLRLTPRGIARIGEMILAGGNGNGVSIVPKAWLDESIQPSVPVDSGFGWPGMRYGYLWYVGEAALATNAGERFVAAFGNGGQRLFIFPDLDFVLSITAGNYNKPDQWRAPAALLFEAFLPSLVRPKTTGTSNSSTG